jgi:hypothetical protein
MKIIRAVVCSKAIQCLDRKTIRPQDRKIKMPAKVPAFVLSRQVSRLRLAGFGGLTSQPAGTNKNAG